MSFADSLGEIVKGCGGGIGALLMGSDGIPIEQFVGSAVPEGPLSDDLATAGVEFGRILHDIRRASDALAGGAVQETVVVLARSNEAACGSPWLSRMFATVWVAKSDPGEAESSSTGAGCTRFSASSATRSASISCSRSVSAAAKTRSNSGSVSDPPKTSAGSGVAGTRIRGGPSIANASPIRASSTRRASSSRP